MLDRMMRNILNKEKKTWKYMAPLITYPGEQIRYIKFEKSIDMSNVTQRMKKKTVAILTMSYKL